MAQLGQYNDLKVIKQVDFGYFLDADDYGDVLLPSRYAPDQLDIGDYIRIFMYRDSEDRVIATTEKPKVLVGHCAYLKAISRNRVGVFMDWGLPKDLLVPFSEQQKPMEQGFSYTVYVYIDKHSDRITASSRLEDHLSVDSSQFEVNQPVSLNIYGKSDLGFKAVIDGTHLGQLYENETFQHLHFGETIAGFIKQIRQDGKMDLRLQLPTQLSRDSLNDQILDYLKQHDGVSELTDKSKPDDIYAAFKVSKSNYKRALSQLYKKRLIVIEKQQITLAKAPAKS